MSTLACNFSGFGWAQHRLQCNDLQHCWNQFSNCGWHAQTGNKFAALETLLYPSSPGCQWSIPLWSVYILTLLSNHTCIGQCCISETDQKIPHKNYIIKIYKVWILFHGFVPFGWKEKKLTSSSMVSSINCSANKNSSTCFVSFWLKAAALSWTGLDQNSVRSLLR